MLRIRILTAGITAGGVLLFSGVAFAQSNLYTFPGPDVDLGPSYLGRVVSGGHYIGGRGDTVYVLREYGHTYCHKSTDAGQTFGPGIQVNSTIGAHNASLKVDTAGVVYVAYQSGDADIYFTKSSDGGMSFAQGIKVNDDTIPQTGQEKPAIAVNNKGHVFIGWGDQRNMPPPSTRNLYFASSFDSGKTFSPNIQINDSSLPIVWGIDIAADDSGKVYLVWNSFVQSNFQGPVFLARSDDSGSSFPVRFLVSDLPFDTSWALFPSLALGKGIVGVAWEEQRGFDEYGLRFAISNNYGQCFTPSVVVDSSGHPQYPSLFWNHGIFYVVWRATHQRNPSGPYLGHIWLSYGGEGGQAFVPYVDAVPNDTNFVPHFRPSIWVNESKEAFVAWTDARWDPVFQENHHLFVSVGVPLVGKGDLNLDGNITIADIVLELNAVFLSSPFPAPFETADGNCDGQLSSADISLLLLATFLGNPFPC